MNVCPVQKGEVLGKFEGILGTSWLGINSSLLSRFEQLDFEEYKEWLPWEQESKICIKWFSETA